MTEHKAVCPMCWALENSDAEAKDVAERRAAIHSEDTGHAAEVVQA